MDMGPGSGLLHPKPEARVKAQRREERIRRDRHSEIHDYVFARERNLCRCCRRRPAASMHEIKPRSLGGKVSRKNSIATCGQLVGVEPSCHTYLQANQIAVGASVLGAEAELIFTPMTAKAAEWMGLKVGEQLISRVMVEIEAET